MKSKARLVKGNYILFENSKECYAHRGIIGLSDKLETYEGYDGEFPLWRALNKEEKIDLSNMMLDRWNDYKSKALREK